MGIIISRFRVCALLFICKLHAARLLKKKSTLEILEDLDKRIRDMETQGVNAAQRCRRVTTRLVLYTVGLYVISVFIWYWYWPPLNFKQQLYRLPAVIFTPILIFLLRIGIKFYYTRKIRSNDKKLVDIRDKKKKIIEEVMDHETYKVAKSILEKFAPESLGGKSAYSMALSASAQQRKVLPAITAGSKNELRQRSIQSTPVQLNQHPMTRASVNSPDFRPNMQVAIPVQPSERTFLDRILEFVIGDGPSNRFALICRSCMCHNGMALKEEFEYLQFRCYYCHHWNPARKQRPQAPKLKDSPARSPTRNDSSGLSSTIKVGEESSFSESEDDIPDNGSSPNGSAEGRQEAENETAELQSDRDDAKSEENSSQELDSSFQESANNLTASQNHEIIKETLGLDSDTQGPEETHDDA